MKMQGINQFLVYMVAAMIVYFLVLTFTIRKRSPRPYIKILLLTLLVTVGGMVFARITYGKNMPWWIFYGIPALLTFLLPPLILRMSWRELLLYIPLAILMSPVIHIFFSFFVGWHDFMPLFYIPSWRQLLG
jgi:hypothetical protein